LAWCSSAIGQALADDDRLFLSETFLASSCGQHRSHLNISVSRFVSSGGVQQSSATSSWMRSPDTGVISNFERSAAEAPNFAAHAAPQQTTRWANSRS
jgi:hypothetical protein